ncbi:hypothetical protein CK203_002864 [Vitis vinifera]|uniref:Uncharacterized protein n=1 Tax=Vitis vinifera TaxID=29760 RepID=A0A438KH35_VITVI|nr:hypothetical protein CK203_002864 [Vitis vinifera]
MRSGRREPNWRMSIRRRILVLLKTLTLTSRMVVCLHRRFRLFSTSRSTKTTDASRRVQIGGFASIRVTPSVRYSGEIWTAAGDWGC